VIDKIVNIVVVVCGVVLAAAFFGGPIVSVALHARMLKLLRSNHHLLWLDVGAPDLWDALAFGGWKFGGIPARSAGGVIGSKYLTWLALDGYEQINDPAVARMGRRLRSLYLLLWVALLAGVLMLFVGRRTFFP
jgi:hypothetical protein